MRLAGIEGIRRRRRVRTTRPDSGAVRPADLVERDFSATEPNRLWVSDLTYVATWAGVAYVCFIIDAYSRRIVGWRVAAHMRTSMVLDALEMARASRGTHLAGLVAHSDAGSQYTSVRWGERLAELGAVPSVGSVGDSYDNALAETVIGLYKTELIRGPTQGPWRNVDDVELATLGLGPLAQHPAPPQPPRRHTASRVRGGLRWPTSRPRTGWKPINRASTKPSAIQCTSAADVWGCPESAFLLMSRVKTHLKPRLRDPDRMGGTPPNSTPTRTSRINHVSGQRGEAQPAKRSSERKLQVVCWVGPWCRRRGLVIGGAL